MVIIAIVCLLAGICCGQWLFPPSVSLWIGDASQWVLALLMLLVGISVGLNKAAF